MIADGLAGGKYAKLIKHMKITEAKGSVLDYIHLGDIKKKYFKN